MELFLSREEMRRRLQARVGHLAGDGQAPLIRDQFNEYLRAAAQEVYTRCAWARTMREARVSVGIDQRVVNYPTGAGPENVFAIGVWDQTRYVPLRRTTIPVHLDDEPLVDEGEPASVSGRGRPGLYECKTQIEVWPRPDQEYELKIDHTINPDLAADGTISAVDGEAIILWAMADVYDMQGDENLAEKARAKFEQRIRRLIGWQSCLPTIRRGGDNHEAANRRRGLTGYVPDSGQWPSEMPS